MQTVSAISFSNYVASYALSSVTKLEPFGWGASFPEFDLAQIASARSQRLENRVVDYPKIIQHTYWFKRHLRRLDPQQLCLIACSLALLFRGVTCWTRAKFLEHQLHQVFDHVPPWLESAKLFKLPLREVTPMRIYVCLFVVDSAARCGYWREVHPSTCDKALQTVLVAQCVLSVSYSGFGLTNSLRTRRFSLVWGIDTIFMIAGVLIALRGCRIASSQWYQKCLRGTDSGERRRQSVEQWLTLQTWKLKRDGGFTLEDLRKMRQAYDCFQPVHKRSLQKLQDRAVLLLAADPTSSPHGTALQACLSPASIDFVDKVLSFSYTTICADPTVLQCEDAPTIHDALAFFRQHLGSPRGYLGLISVSALENGPHKQSWINWLRDRAPTPLFTRDASPLRWGFIDSDKYSAARNVLVSSSAATSKFPRA